MSSEWGYREVKSKGQPMANLASSLVLKSVTGSCSSENKIPNMPYSRRWRDASDNLLFGDWQRFW